MTYREQIDHPLWKERSAAFKEEVDCGQCRCCGTDRNLTVHHKRYLRDGYLWEVPDEWLETLCWNCHRRRHEVESAIRLMDTADFLAQAEENSSPDESEEDEDEFVEEEEEEEAYVEDIRRELEAEQDENRILRRQLEESEEEDYLERARKDPFCFEHWM